MSKENQFMTDNREIQVTDINGISIGHASNQDAGTGVTVLHFPNGAKAGCDIVQRNTTDKSFDSR